MADRFRGAGVPMAGDVLPGGDLDGAEEAPGILAPSFTGGTATARGPSAQVVVAAGGNYYALGAPPELPNGRRQAARNAAVERAPPPGEQSGRDGNRAARLEAPPYESSVVSDGPVRNVRVSAFPSTRRKSVRPLLAGFGGGSSAKRPLQAATTPPSSASGGGGQRRSRKVHIAGRDSQKPGPNVVVEFDDVHGLYMGDAADHSFAKKCAEKPRRIRSAAAAEDPPGEPEEAITSARRNWLRCTACL
ncbi:MAG: hypothetical protein BJ554DRAFT_6006, partial [Olpidium bornovanus]